MEQNDAPGPPPEATQTPNHHLSSDLAMTNHGKAPEAQAEQPLSPPMVQGEPPAPELGGNSLGWRVGIGVDGVKEAGGGGKVSKDQGINQWYDAHTIKPERIQLMSAQVLARQKILADYRERRRLQKEEEVANGQRDASGKLLWWPNKQKGAREAWECKNKEIEGHYPQGSGTQESPTQEFPAQDSLIQNYFTQNSFTQNSFAQNYFTQNPFAQNYFTQNSFTQNPFTQNPFIQGSVIPGPLIQEFLAQEFCIQDPLLHRVSTEVSLIQDSFIQESLSREFESKKRKWVPEELQALARADEQRETVNQRCREKRQEEARQEIALGLRHEDGKLKQIQYRRPIVEAVLSGSRWIMESPAHLSGSRWIMESPAHEYPVQGPSTGESSTQQLVRRSGRNIASRKQVVGRFETYHTPHPPAQKSPTKDSPAQKPTNERKKRVPIVDRLTADELEERRIQKVQRQRDDRQQQKELEIARGLRDAKGKLLWWPNKQRQAREAKEAAREAKAREAEAREAEAREAEAREAEAREAEARRAREESSVQGNSTIISPEVCNDVGVSTIISPEVCNDVGVSTITPDEHQRAEEAPYMPYAYAHTEAVIRNSGWTATNDPPSSVVPRTEFTSLSGQWWKALQ